jgi:RHS repeat-associated protein
VEPLKAGHSKRIYFITDSLSTVRNVVSSTGAVVASYEFDAYGAKISPANTGEVESQKTFVGGLSVQDEVADTGLMMMGHRFYDPGLLGRFLNRDPIGFRGGMNLFAYSNSSPVDSVDPVGLQSTHDQAGWTNSFPSEASTVATEIVIFEMLGKASMNKWKPIVAKILSETTVLWANHESADGWAGREGFIYIDRSLPRYDRARTLFHEILHRAADKAKAGDKACDNLVPYRAHIIDKEYQNFETTNIQEHLDSKWRNEMWVYAIADLMYVKGAPASQQTSWTAKDYVTMGEHPHLHAADRRMTVGTSA